MDRKKYLIYLDILGFKPLAEEIASRKGIDPRMVRDGFIRVINEQIKILEAEGKIIGKKYGNSDDWILVTDALDKTFTCINEILDHNTGFKGYEAIPLEIAIGTGEYDRWAKFEGENLIVEDPTIDFIKTNIIGHYHKWYKEENKQSPKSTFIILTEPAYQELEPLDKKICQKQGEANVFFIVDVEKAKQRGRMFGFLEKNRYPGHKWYGRIDELYVPPLEYEDIKKTLKEKRIVFITGIREYQDRVI